MPDTSDAPVLNKGPSKSQEITALQKRCDDQRNLVVKRERELAELTTKLATTQKEMDDLCRETGARSQRINVNTLKGTPAVKQVGNEMAVAIRKRQMRRKEHLRDKINKLTTKLGSKLAHNRELKAEIDHRRLARLHHIAAVKDGSFEVEHREDAIKELIVAAQRAYAEKEQIVLRLGDLKRRANEESYTYVREMEQCDTLMEDLDDECKQRDVQVEDLMAEVAAAVQLARQAEEERAAEVERFAAVRNQRLELQNSLHHVYDTLRVDSDKELVDGYRATSSKVLSLWGRQGEQEGELEELQTETTRLSKEVDLAQASETRWRTLALSRQAVKMATDKGEADAEADLLEREAALHALCASLSAAFATQPLLKAQLPEGAPMQITPHTLLPNLARVEGLVVRLVGRKIADQAAVAKAERLEAERAAEEAFFLQPAVADDAKERRRSSIVAMPDGMFSIEAAPSAEEADAGGRRGRIGVMPPSMTADAHGAFNLQSDSRLGERPQREHLGDSKNNRDPSLDFGKLKYGRASLRSELMGKILAGVTGQMDVLAAEERGPPKDAHGGGHADSLKSGARSGGLATPHGPNIDKSQRDTSIDEWLARRRGGAPQHHPVHPEDRSAAGGSAVSIGSALPPGRAPRKAGGVKVKGGPSPAHVPGQPLRMNSSAPTLFAANSGREILNSVTRITADVSSSRAFAAEMLPKLPAVGEGYAPAANPAGGMGLFSDPSAMPSSSGATDPRREIEEINRRLAMLEQERLQINQLKHMAVAAGNMAAQHPGTAPANGGRAGMSSANSLATIPAHPPKSSGGLPLAGSRSTGNLPLQPIAGGRQQQRVR